jgi:hypothetical protein
MSAGFALIMRLFQAFTGNPDSATYPKTYPRIGPASLCPSEVTRSPPLSYKAF